MSTEVRSPHTTSRRPCTKKKIFLFFLFFYFHRIQIPAYHERTPLRELGGAFQKHLWLPQVLCNSAPRIITTSCILLLTTSCILLLTSDDIGKRITYILYVLCNSDPRILPTYILLKEAYIYTSSEFRHYRTLYIVSTTKRGVHIWWVLALAPYSEY